ncbi:MAG: amidohydrolase family protein [Planctomycetaceae bacterium]|nr:amidohydrolase family protein [Planctomycetaceae bacterium]
MNSSMSRRTMLAVAASAAAAPLLSATESLAAIDDDEKHPWIDAHSHIWTTDLKAYPLRNNQTVDVLAPRSFTDEELMAVAEPVGVGRVVLIQHHPYHGFDNSYLIDTWKKHQNRFRIVGQIDDTKPHVDQTMKTMKQTGVTGFRIGPRDDRKDWLGGDGMKLMWKTGAETGQSMCCLINPENIPQVSEWCGKFPETPVVIDHFARVGITGEIRESDVAALCGLSKHSTVRVKISAYYALGKKRPPHDELAPMIKRLFESFGPDRLMWASDSPYQLGAPNTYADSIRLVQERLDFVNEADRRKLLRTTAESTFFLP